MGGMPDHDGWDARRAYDDLRSEVHDQGDDIRQNTTDIRDIKRTLATMASDEIADLRRRAEAPRRFVNAVLLACAATVTPALIIYAFSHLHIH